MTGPLLDEIGVPYEPALEPTSLDNFHVWLTLGTERIPLEVTFLTDASGQFNGCVRDCSWVAATTPPPRPERGGMRSACGR